MKIINPYIIVHPFAKEGIMQNIERAGRICYKSEDKITPESSIKFARNIIKSGHESVLEHQSISVVFVCDRGVSHEIVRHRVAAYSQESTRYCNYSRSKFSNEITVIKPYFFTGELEKTWRKSCQEAEDAYMRLLDLGASAQEARSVLPNSLKTEIATTYNIREWRHFFTLRADKAAHPQMQQLAIPLLLHFKEHLPDLFYDIPYNQEYLGEYAAIA